MSVALVAAVAQPATASAEETRVAAGGSMSLQVRDDYGSGSRTMLVPELLGVAYLATTVPRLYLRPGVRLGYGGLEQAEMPEAVQLREYDLELSAEVAVLYDGLVVPSLAVGAGAVARWIRVDLGAPLVGGTDETRFERMPALHAQLGLGVPLARGALVLEPFVRFDRIFGDDRVGWGVGVDATVALR